MTVIVNNLSNVVDITIAISALVKAKAPVAYHSRQANYVRDLLSNFNRGGTSKEVKIEYAAKSIVLEVLASCIVDLDVHAIRIEK